MRGSLRRSLTRGVIASIVLPMVLTLVAGLGALLASVGDRVGAVVCGRVALVLAVVWAVAVVATAVASALLVLEADGGRRDRRPCRGGGRRRRYGDGLDRGGPRGRRRAGRLREERERFRPPEAGKAGD